MSRFSTIELFKESMKFSAGHFAIFSETKRENLHGHNYNVCFKATTILDDDGLGMNFDYRFYINKLKDLCEEINGVALMPSKSQFLRLEDAGDYWHVYFDQEKLFFLKRDLKILPINNITVEELSNYLLNRVLENTEELEQNRIQQMEVKVFSGSGQSGSASWSKS